MTPPGPNAAPFPPGSRRRPVKLLIAGGGTGGHLMPALAIGSAMRTKGDWEVALVGAERGLEATLLPTKDFPYTLLPFEPIYRRQWWKNLRWPALAWHLVREVTQLLDRVRPDIVLGTGGYVAGPVIWAAARRRLPTAILEQDAYPGLVTRWLAGRVDEVFLGVGEAEEFLRPGETTSVVVTGSPIAPPTPERRPAARRRFGLAGSALVILVTGGSQGSVAINELVAGWLERDGERLAGRLTLIWATGRGSYSRFARWHRPPAVQVFDFLDPIADAYAVADVVVARAGMMTIAEICAWGLASILIPLPSAAADHQTKNARALAEAGAAIHLVQAGLTPATFGDAVDAALFDPARLAALRVAARDRGRPDALATIAARLEGLTRARPTFSNS